MADMSDEPDGYITDVAYTHGYFDDISPHRTRLAFLKAGLPVPEIATACELGFGQGVSLAIHAAASPVIWYGTDFHPEHVKSATALVEATGVDAHLYADDFADFAERKDLPDFDYIALYGVWSWVSDETRASIVDVVRRKLKIGGVLCLGYISQGWAPYVPLRNLLAGHADSIRQEGLPLVDRIESSLAFADRLRQVNAAYFADNPAVARYLSTMSTKNRRYLAHDYFNGHYRPMDFPTVAKLLAPAQLNYVGPADAGSLESVYLTRPQQALLATVADLNFREVVHDFLVNRYARCEYWVKGPVSPLQHRERDQLLRDTRIIALTPRPDLPVKLRAALALNGTGPSEKVYRPILEALGSLNPLSLGEIERRLRADGTTLDQIFEAVLLIAGLQQIDLFQDEAMTGKARRYAARLNTHLLERQRSGDGLDYLASPVTAAGVKLDRCEQLWLLAARDGIVEPQGLAKMAFEHLSRDPQGERGSLAALTDRAHQFATARLLQLKALGIT
jgi:hypothetical protein